MINTSKPFNIDEYKEIIIRRLYFILAPFALIAIVTIAYAYSLPSYFEAKTLIIASPQRIPSEFVRATVPSLVAAQLHSIEQEIKSQTLLEQIIKEFNLQLKYGKSNSADVIQYLRKNINVQVSQRHGGDNSGGYFTIAYIDKDPVLAANITNRIAALFIEDSLKIREHQASLTTDFMKEELESSRKKLERQENIVRAFKMHHMGELPEQRDTNIRMLEQLQQSHQRAGESLRAAQDRQIVLQRQISDIEYPIMVSQDSRGVNSNMASSGGHEGSGDPQIYELRNQYSELKSKYREGHPDLKRIKKQIDEMESNKQIDIRNSPRYIEMKNQLASINLEIKRLKEEEFRTKNAIDVYRNRIERTTEREQQLTSITREYQNTKDFHDSLLKKSQEASQAENLEKRQKGEQFRVIDPATPDIPVRSQKKSTLLIGLLIGASAGLGLGFVREQMDHSFHDPADVETTLGLKTIANIPQLNKSTR